MRLRLDALRTRLLLVLGSGLVAVMVVQAALAYRSTRDQLDEVFDAQMVQVAQAVARGMPHAALDAPDAAEDDFDLQVRRYATSRRDARRYVVGALETIVRGGHRLRRVTVDDRGTQTEVTQDLDARREAAADVALASVGAPVAVGTLVMAGLLALLARMLAPLESLRRDVAARSPDDRAPLQTSGLPAELEPVVAELNRLMGRMQHALDVQRTFVADAAHELRTPLAALALQVDVVERASDQDEQDTALARLRAGLARAARVAEQLLDLARADRVAASPLPREPVEVLPMLQQLLGERLPWATTKRLQVHVDVPATALVFAERNAVRTMLANLVDNAYAYTPDGGSVHVRWRADPDTLELVVADSGPGIPDAERARVRERFYRLPGTAPPGSGLGLAIVDELAISSGARLDLGTSDLGGLEARVTWPNGGASPSDTSVGSSQRGGTRRR